MSVSAVPYLKSFFKHDELLRELKLDLMKVKNYDIYLDDNEAQMKLDILCTWLRSTPGTTTYRVNTLTTDTATVIQCIKNELTQQCRQTLPSILTFPNVPELIIVNSWNSLIDLNLQILPNEVIVDAACGVAVLRGAHIFAPGVMGIPRGLKIGDRVSVFADLTGNCKKGLIKQCDQLSKMFLGNGIVKMPREYLFRHNVQDVSGVAVQMTDIISRLPNLSDSIIPKGHALLQNLPSIICTRILDPRPGEIILDMCAAPGHKTTHIAALMKNEGTVIALEKRKSKVERMKITCDNFSVRNVKIFCFDSTEAVHNIQNKLVIDGPPFLEESFDRVLLDSPCSALGQRPQLFNPITIKQLGSYVPLQRKLFSAAVRLVKPGGILVYSTCTITVAENESIVSWALRTYSCLELQSVKEKIHFLGLQYCGSSGLNVEGLTQEQSDNLCRFGPADDTVGFFIACFVKKKCNE